MFATMPLPAPPAQSAWERDDPEYMELEIILCHLIRNMRFMEGAHDRINTYSVFAGTPDLQIIWEVFSAFCMEYERLPAEDVLKKEYAEQELRQPQLDWQYIREMTDRWLAVDEADFNVEYAAKLLSEHVEARVRSQLADVQQQETGELVEYLDRARMTLSSPVTSRVQFKNPFWGDPNQYLREIKKIPIGVPWIDQATGGGQRPGDLIGFIMPSGVGKTTLTWQIIKECVVRGVKVAHFSFEQNIEGDQTIRAYVLASDSCRKDWKSMDMNRVSPDVRRRWEQSRQAWSEYLISCDEWVKRKSVLPGVSAMFESLEDTGAEVALFDWWGPMLYKLKESLPYRPSEKEARELEAHWLWEIKPQLQNLGMRGFIFHQKSGDASGKSARYVGSSHDAQENKSFNNYTDFCFVSSRKDTDQVVRFSLDKARAAESSIVSVKLDGERCQFIGDTPDYGVSLAEAGAERIGDADEDPFEE